MVDFKLRTFMADRKISRDELAYATGIRKATITAYNKGDFKMIPLDHIDKLCKFFNVTPGELLIYIPDKE